MHQTTGHIGIIIRQYKFLHFRKYSRHFHSRGTTTYDNDIQQLLLFLFVGAGHSTLQVGEKRISEPHSFGHVFHWHGLLFDMFITEEIGRRTCGKNQIVVFRLPYGSLYHVLFGENSTYFRHTEIKIFPMLEYLAEREGNGSRFHNCRGQLIN